MASVAVRNLENLYDEKLKMGFATVLVAGVPEKLWKFSQACYEIVIQARRTNTGRIYIGGDNVPNDDTTGVYLLAGEKITIHAQNLLDVSINSTVNNEGVNYFYW